MERLSVFIFISCLTAFCVAANRFDCGDLSSAACRTKFGAEYEASFKIIHIAAINDFYNLLKSISDNILNELPSDDVVSIKLKETLETLSEDMKQLNAKKDDPKEVEELLTHMMKSTKWGPKNIYQDEQYKRLVEKYKITEVFPKRLYELIHDIATLYTDMYAGLRDVDLKDYPEYVKMNDVMKDLLETKDEKEKFSLYSTFKEYIGTEFNLPYLTAVQDTI